MLVIFVRLLYTRETDAYKKVNKVIIVILMGIVRASK